MNSWPERLLTAFLFLSSGFAYLAARIIASQGTSESPLQSFYLEGFSDTLTQVSMLLLALAVACILYLFSATFRGLVQRIVSWSSAYLRTSSTLGYALISFMGAAAVLFLLNAPGILYGTFMIDDYKMYGIATEYNVWKLLWTPINDHVIPLFWLELKALFFLIGANPPLLNFPLFVPAILTIGGAAILLRMLGLGSSTLFVLLATFASTLVVSHQLYGFYAIAPYFQVLALFVFSLICFVRAHKEEHFSYTYQALSLVLLAMALLLESGGIWTGPAYVLFVYAFEVLRSTSWIITATLRTHAGTLITTLFITLSYVTYLLVLPHYTTESFFGVSRLPISFHTLLELYHVITAGTLLSLFAPRLGLILSQPRLEMLIVPWWHVAMFVLFCAFLFIIVHAWRKGTLRARILVSYFSLLMLGTALLTAIARPSSNPAAFYRDQNLLFPLFFLSLALAVFIHEWIQSAPTEPKKRSRIVVTITLLIVVVMSQVTFSFYKQLYIDDIKFNRSLTERLHTTLAPALNELSSVSTAALQVPSLSSLYLRGDGYHQTPELSAFSSFIGVKNVAWLPIYEGSYRASTSPAFMQALTNDERIREWYLANGEMQETCVTNTFGTQHMSVLPYQPFLLAAYLGPAQKHLLEFSLETQDAPEKIFIDLSFRNDFNATGTRGYIRLDQYTKTATTPLRQYVCTVDLNEIPAFALSKQVSNLNITITTPGEYYLNGLELKSR